MDLSDAMSRIVVPLLGVLGVIAAAWIANRHAELKRLEVIEAQCRVIAALPVSHTQLAETMSVALSKRVAAYGAWVNSRHVRFAIDAASALLWVYFLASFARSSIAEDYPRMQDFTGRDYVTFGVAATAFASLLTLGFRAVLRTMFISESKSSRWLEKFSDDLIEKLIARRQKPRAR
jgi:hypothetical protein